MTEMAELFALTIRQVSELSSQYYDGYAEAMSGSYWPKAAIPQRPFICSTHPDPSRLRLASRSRRAALTGTRLTAPGTPSKAGFPKPGREPHNAVIPPSTNSRTPVT